MHAGCAFYSQQAERQLGVLQNLCTNSNSMYVVLYLVNKSFHIIPKIKKKEMYCKVKKNKWRAWSTGTNQTMKRPGDGMHA